MPAASSMARRTSSRALPASAASADEISPAKHSPETASPAPSMRFLASATPISASFSRHTLIAGTLWRTSASIACVSDHCGSTQIWLTERRERSGMVILS